MAVATIGRKFYHFRVVKDSDWIIYYNGKFASSNLFPTVDVSSSTTKEELTVLAGLPADSKKAQPKELWRFRNTQVGDIIIANKAIDHCRGIGIITGEYTFNPTKPNKHIKSVNWLTKKEYIFIKERYVAYFAETGKPFDQLFYNETFDNIEERLGKFIIEEYIKKYPDLEPVLTPLITKAEIAKPEPQVEQPLKEEA